jgi:hypothetical protein
MGARCCTSTIRDGKTITKRVEHEGLSFLTITLPAFGKEFEKALDQGKVDSTDFVGYAKKGCLPKFLWGFTSQLFNPSSGLIVHEPDSAVVQAVRQICLLYSKVLLPCSDARVDAAFKGYMDCEQSVRTSDSQRSAFSNADFYRVSSLLLRDVLHKVNEDVYHGRIIPKHGPGSTADRISGNQKYNNRTWTSRLEEIFPAGEFLFSSWRYFDASLTEWLEPGAEIPVRVISVPKTLKTPRIIAIEPTHMQYVQQGLWLSIREHVERDDILSQFIGFSDQVPNQDLAREGSLTGELATLDLSEASDRVSNQLVRLMLEDYNWLAPAVDSCRSRKADVPGYGVHRLAKFASMGSALCFPIEAMVFLTCVFIGIERELMRPLTKKDIKSFLGKVRVYGDDIIVPVEYVHSVSETLQTFGFVVNSGKSFWTGKFRESCGKEFFNGEDVSIVRVRRVFPTEHKHAQEIISCVSLRNQMYFAGNWGIARFLDDFLKKLIPLPTVSRESPALGRHSFLPFYEEKRWDHNLQRGLVKAFMEVARLPEDFLEDDGALVKCFINRGEPYADVRHLERAGRPDAVSIKLGWVPSY